MEGGSYVADSFYNQDEGPEVVGSTESVDVTEGSVTVDTTWNLAVIFILSMIVGLLIFGSLSRRWHA